MDQYVSDLDEHETQALRRVRRTKFTSDKDWFDDSESEYPLIPSSVATRMPRRSTFVLNDDDDDAYGSLSDDFEVSHPKRRRDGDQVVYVIAPDTDRIEKEFGPADDPSKCNACTLGRSDTPAMPYRVYNRINMMFRDRRAHCDEIELINKMWALYEKYRHQVNSTLKRGQCPIPEWRKPTMWAHQTEHRQDSAEELLKRSIEIKNMIKYQYRNRTYARGTTESGESTEFIDPAGLKTYKELLILQLRVLNSKPAQMILASNSSPNLAYATPFMDPSDRNVYGFNPGGVVL